VHPSKKKAKEGIRRIERQRQQQAQKKKVKR
jgi:hypothetical protein